jgi:hypothetical protein
MKLALFLVSSGLLLTAPLMAASRHKVDGNKKVVEVTNTQNLPFQPGGTIHVNHSYGELSVEGWDRPEVEVTVIKSPDEIFSAKDQTDAAKRVENVKVTVDRHSDTDIAISTAVTNFKRFWHPFGPAGHVVMQYRIHVPRNSKLVIHHDHGDVLVSQVVGDIEATGEHGDIVLLLSEKEKYSIDAKSKFGTVNCDFDGAFEHGMYSSRYSLTAPAPAHRIVVTEGVGGIDIKGSPAEAQPAVAGSLQ